MIIMKDLVRDFSRHSCHRAPEAINDHSILQQPTLTKWSAQVVFKRCCSVKASAKRKLGGRGCLIHVVTGNDIDVS